MVQPTSPDNIAAWDNLDPGDLIAESQAQAASIQVALNNRQRYDFVWATSAERAAQTGMRQGDRGYQIDTKSEYIYDNLIWRLSVSYGEYVQNPAQSIPNTTEVSFTNLIYQTSASTDPLFTSVNTSNGEITIVNPGVYAMSLTVGIAGGANGLYAALRPDTTGTQPPYSLSPFSAGSSTVSLPFLRTTTANQKIYPRMYQNTGAAINTLYVILRIGRLG